MRICSRMAMILILSRCSLKALGRAALDDQHPEQLVGAAPEIAIDQLALQPASRRKGQTRHGSGPLIQQRLDLEEPDDAKVNGFRPEVAGEKFALVMRQAAGAETPPPAEHPPPRGPL